MVRTDGHNFEDLDSTCSWEYFFKSNIVKNVLFIFLFFYANNYATYVWFILK